MVLGPTSESYTDLISREFLFMHGVQCLGDNLCSFSSHVGYKVAYLETHFSQVKDWFKRFFSKLGWRLFYAWVEAYLEQVHSDALLTRTNID